MNQVAFVILTKNPNERKQGIIKAVNSFSTVTIKIMLTGIIILLLAVNIVPAWQVYQSRMSIKTDSPSGSSLAERYLILGDWPAVSSVIEDNDKYTVTPSKQTQVSPMKGDETLDTQ